ncbi:MAG: tRNA (adenosine(37)-N6)-dimethylallyltransferase MiaA [Demequinaceae bacterium]|nr:tRNA (adenosine(37)-N6)-dimethylallyltransferase MiaA [Demequinaceae bacterium]
MVAIVGATATGKSAVSLEVAHLIEQGGEVINADSMQFYQGMDIGTAKLPLSGRRDVPHHQLDTLAVGEDASVAHFQESARADVEAIHARGHRAIVVGGSGLYLRALLDRFDFPGTDPALRARLEARAEAEGPGILHRELAALDPTAAAKIHPRNAKRIVRALEIIEVAGDYTSSLPRHEYHAPAVQIALEVPYEVLVERIESRVDAMWEEGLVEEVRGLAGRGLRESVTARRAVGYAEVLRYIDGELTEAEARDLVKRNTRRLARKQDRWFRPDPRVTWIAGPRDVDDVKRCAKEALDIVAAQSGSASA